MLDIPVNSQESTRDSREGQRLRARLEKEMRTDNFSSYLFIREKENKTCGSHNFF